MLTSLPRNPLEAETSVDGSETGSGVGAETSFNVGFRSGSRSAQMAFKYRKK
jgi:hypothetical protein